MNRSLLIVEPVSGSPKRKPEKRQQRLAAETRRLGHMPRRSPTSETRPVSLTYGNVARETTAQRPHWMAEDAVLVGPVSTCNSLLWFKWYDPSDLTVDDI